MIELSKSIIALLSRGIKTRAELQSELRVSQPTLSRAIAQLGDKVVRIGASRSTRYGLRREMPQIGSSWPLFIIDEHGQAVLHSYLNALARDQYWLDAATARHSIVTDGLPYFLQDLWPQGFIGRTVPKRYPELDLPDRVNDWNEVHVLTYLTQRGEDCVGNLLIGNTSLQRYLQQFQEAQILIDPDDRPHQYPRLADAALSGAPPGSSAGGEHPKFTIAIRQRDKVRHALVKFSPPVVDRVAQRWSDLLICEGIASQVLSRAGLTKSSVEIIVANGRTFLESERFDRKDRWGRLGVVSIGAAANHFLGKRDTWTSTAKTLAEMGQLSAADVEAIRRIETFGRLIANSDMHFGNLSFFFSFDAPLTLAPVYDMLPMLYAPIAGDALPDREFEPRLPGADNIDIWNNMAELAITYWQTASLHEQISEEFRGIARRNAELIDRIRRTLPGIQSSLRPQIRTSR